MKIHFRQHHIIITGITLILVFMALDSFAAEARQQVVLFDEGHGQRFLAERNGDLDLSGLSALFHQEGMQVKTNKGEITEKVLAETDAFVISGAFVSFTPSEMSAIVDFVEQGGSLCVMLHVGLPVAELLSKLHVYVSKGVVHEQENLISQTEVDYYVISSSQHELMKGVVRFKIFGGWALLTDNEKAETLAQTSTGAWIDTNMNNERDANELQRSLGLAIAGKMGDGSFAVFGDDAIFQNRSLSEENMQLGINLAKWLNRKESVSSQRAFL